MVERPVVWVGSTLQRIRAFPESARREAGHDLHMVQLGLEPTDGKPMPAVGAGVIEIRVHADGEHRLFYLAKFQEAIYVLHAFAKKTQRTRRADIELGRKNLSEVLRHQRER